MRTTLTLDDDLAAALKEQARRADQPFKQVVNDTLRRGLSPGTRRGGVRLPGHAPRQRFQARRRSVAAEPTQRLARGCRLRGLAAAVIVPDLNLLVYAHSAGAPLHEPARHWWEDLVNGTERVGVPWLVAAGFVRLLTHPSVLSTPAAPEHAVDLMAQWFRSPSVTPLNPGTQHIAIFRSMAGRRRRSGGTSSPTPTSPRWPSSTKPRSTPTTATSPASQGCAGATRSRAATWGGCSQAL